MKKVAICISGVIREPESCIPYMKGFINEIKTYADVDVFIYTSRLTQTGFIPQKSKYLKTRKEDFHESNTSDYDGNHVFKFKDEEVINYINSLEPKKYIIDDERKELKTLIKKYLPEKYENWKHTFFRAINQFYNGECCNKLKIEYEQEHNFKYDLVFRFRPDLYIQWWDNHAPTTKEKWDYYLRDGDWKLRGRDKQIHVSYIDILQGQVRIGDNYYYGTSGAMDNFFKDMTINSLLYLKSEKGVIPGYCEEPHPEAIWGNQLLIRKCTATNHSHGHFKHEVMRCSMKYDSDPKKAGELLKKSIEEMWYNHRTTEIANKKEELSKIDKDDERHKHVVERLERQIRELTQDLQHRSDRPF